MTQLLIGGKDSAVNGRKYRASARETTKGMMNIFEFMEREFKDNKTITTQIVIQLKVINKAFKNGE